jgi:primase-polymerase (primpol)-like protein
VEIYSEKRYFTMTGMQYSNCVEIADDTGSLAWIHDTFIKPPKKQTSSARGKVAKGTSCLSDDELIKMATKSKDTDFAPLWNGSWQGMYKSQSEADMALCGKIAWWANADYSQTDRLFRQSGLMREKWTGDYASETVRIACDNIVDGFTRVKKSAPRQDKEVTIFEQNGGYYLQRGNNVKQLTTYYFPLFDYIESLIMHVPTNRILVISRSRDYKIKRLFSSNSRSTSHGVIQATIGLS